MSNKIRSLIREVIPANFDVLIREVEPIEWLLRDDFTLDVAAGQFAGDNLIAVPGPGGRTPVDVDINKISISSGRLQFLTGSSGWGDTGLGLTSIVVSRAQGRILISSCNVSSGNGPEILWSKSPSNLALSNWDHGIGRNATTEYIQIYENAGLNVKVGTFNTLIDYNIALILRTVGSFYLMKGGAFVNWCLVYISPFNSNTNLYPFLANDTSVSSFDFLRIPTILWTPRPLSADSFTGTWPLTDGGGLTGLEAGGSGKTWTPSATWSISGGAAVNAPVGGAECVDDVPFSVAGNWTPGTGWDVGVTTPGVATAVAGTASSLIDTNGTSGIVGTWYRISASLTVSAGAFQLSEGHGYLGASIALGTSRAVTTDKPAIYKNATGVGTADDFLVKPLPLSQLITSINHTGTPDVYASVKPTIATGFQAGIAFNIDDPNNPANFNLVYYNRNDGKVYWDRCVNGVWTNHSATTATYAAGAPLVVRKIGTSVYIWYNNAFVYSGTATVLTGNYHGMFQTGNGAAETKLEEWRCYGSGSNNEYSILDAFSQ